MKLQANHSFNEIISMGVLLSSLGVSFSLLVILDPVVQLHCHANWATILLKDKARGYDNHLLQRK